MHSIKTLQALSHELGNLAHRLTLLSASLESQIADPTQRGEAIELLRDTTRKLKDAARALREDGGNA